MESLEEKIARVVNESVEITPYDERWPQLFQEEKEYLLSSFPNDLIKRVEHFGSTAVPGLTAKPIIDMLVEVSCLERTKIEIAPILESKGYDYFWRPNFGDDTPPCYAWLIKRNKYGVRTHHIHMVEKDFEHWERLLFRDYLIENPEIAREYQELKNKLSEKYKEDRVLYTKEKTEFIVKVTLLAKKYYGKLSE